MNLWKSLLDVAIVGLAFASTTVLVYAGIMRADESVHKNRLFSTSVAGVALASCIAGAIVHTVASHAYGGQSWIQWAHCAPCAATSAPPS